MNQIGIIESIDGDSAIVRINRTSACGENCAGCKGGCTPTQQLVSAKNNVNAKEGEKVLLYMPSSTVLGAAAAVYIIPLAVLIISYILFNMHFSEIISILLAGAATALVYALIAAVSKKNKNKYQLVIEKIIKM